MKQYVHPSGEFIAKHTEYSLYTVEQRFYKGKLMCNEKQIKELGFIEKEEEPDTDTKWIDDVHSEYLEAIVSNSLYVGDDRFTDDDRLAVLKKAILSHMPKGKCK